MNKTGIALAVASLLALAAGSAQAALVTFDLTASAYESVARDATITSDRGTTAQIRGYTSLGNVLDSVSRDVYGTAPSGAFISDVGDNVAFFSCGGRGCERLELLFPSNVHLVSVTVNNLVGYRDDDPTTPAPRTVNAFFDIGTYNSGVKTVLADGLPPISPTTFDFSGDFAFGNLLGMGTAFPGGISIRSITVNDPSAVPLPGTLLLIGAGLLGMGAVRRKKLAA